MAYQQSQANQMNAQMAQNQALTDGLSNVASTAISAGAEDMFGKKKVPVIPDTTLDTV